MSKTDLTTLLQASGLTGISSAHDSVGIEHALERLAVAAQPLNDLAHALVADAAARHLKTLGIQRATRIVDAALHRKTKAAKPVLYPPITPAQAAVDSATLITDLIACLERFLYLPRWGTIKLALWILFTYLWEVFDTSPQLAITSAASESGKSRVFDVLWYLVVKPWRMTAATTASLFREIDREHPTVLFDEFDNVDTGVRKDLIAILNAAHTRDGAYVPRCEGDEHEPRLYNVFTPRAVAGIGQYLPETTWSRCIVIEMQPKPDDAPIARLIRRDVGDLFADLRSRIARWALDHTDRLQQARPELPAGLGDRAADSYAPLFAIADEFGEPFATLARRAAVESVDGNFAEVAQGRLLLSHIRDVFARMAVDRLPSVRLLEELTANLEWPWRYRGKQGLTPYELSQMLKPYRVGKPKPLYIKGQPYTTDKDYAKGYYLKQFQPAFDKFLRNIPMETALDCEPWDAAESTAPPPDITDITVISPPSTPKPDGAPQ